MKPLTLPSLSGTPNGARIRLEVEKAIGHLEQARRVAPAAVPADATSLRAFCVAVIAHLAANMGTPA
jgi:hypothetical protein